MAQDTNSQDEYGYYICGQCHTKIEYLLSDGQPDICPDCNTDVTLTGKYSGTVVRSKGWEHNTKDKKDVPSEVKLDLTQY